MDVVKLDFPDRDLFILKDGDWRGFRSTPCAKEPETVEWIRSFKADEHFWDIGASVGPYSLIAAEQCVYIDAFEPFAPSYGHLVQNVWLNNQFDYRGTHCWPVAFGNHTGSTEFHVSSPHAGSASHGSNGSGSHVALMYRVDDFLKTFDVEHGPEPSFPDHVKIDVDGYELGVIEGGRATWKQVDSIMVESQPPTVDDITVILQAAGLQLVDSWKRLGETKQRNYLYRRQA